MENMQSMETIVLDILKVDLKARKDDYVLMLRVCEKVKPDILNHPFWLVMENHRFNGLPNWETVTRCRRKIQAKHPFLKAPKATIYRAEEEKKYKEYSRS